jgi:hypothetical protein
MKRQMKSKEAGSNDDSAVKLKYAESKLTELQTTLSALGKEATAAMLAVEMQQQKITYERLLAMVSSEILSNLCNIDACQSYIFNFSG